MRGFTVLMSLKRLKFKKWTNLEYFTCEDCIVVGLVLLYTNSLG